MLGLGVAGALGVGGIRQQGQHALLAQLGKAAQVDHGALGRGHVNFKVAGVDNGPRRAVDGQGHGVGDGVVHVDELHVHAAQLDMAARRGDMEVRRAQVVLLQLALDKADGQGGAVHRHVELFHQIGHGADVVLVAVGNHHAPDALPVLLHKGEIGDDAVHAGHVLIGEGQAAVHNDHVPLALVQGKVLANLVEAPQEIHLDGRLLGLFGAAAPALAGGALLLGLLLGLDGLHLGRCLADGGGGGFPPPLAGSAAAAFRLFLPGGGGLFLGLLGLGLFLLCLAAGALPVALGRLLLGAGDFPNLRGLCCPAEDLVLLAAAFLPRGCTARPCVLFLFSVLCHAMFLLTRISNVSYLYCSFEMFTSSFAFVKEGRFSLGERRENGAGARKAFGSASPGHVARH